MNVTFTRITLNDDRVFLTGGYVGEADDARDLFELHEYAEENGLSEIRVRTEWFYFSDEEPYNAGEAISASDEQLEHINDHMNELWFELLEYKSFTVNLEQEDDFET